MQLEADLVLEQDEGLDQDFALRSIDRLEHAGVAASVSCGPRELYVRSKRALVDDDVRQVRRLLSRYERMRYGPASENVTRADVRALRRAIRAFKPRPNPL